ncbi:hypothetical protein [Polaromonas eurypsychrophila]|uniref:hypothetical protein n=1 Tax=Polaromonas eurypsychrophila TaxID=1614635 RepID=UPI001669CA5F|nr:hypothetical protein [Polaromonas eurypsychrophila]
MNSAIDSKMTGLLLASTLGLLFIGFIKKVLPWPVDMTLVSLGLMVATVLIHPRRIEVVAHSKVVVILVIFLLFMAVRLVPTYSLVGMEKFAHLFFIGMPVFFSGFIIGQSELALKQLLKVVQLSGTAISIFLVLSVALGLTSGRQSFLSGGYQLTGVLIGLALIGGAIERRSLVVAIAALGLAVCGNLSSALFASFVTLAILVLRRDFRLAASSASLTIVLTSGYAVLFEVPILVDVMVSKVIGLSSTFPAAFSALSSNISWPDIGAFRGDDLGSADARVGSERALVLPEGFDPRAKTDEASANRIWLFADAARHWAEAPLVGGGFGALTYLLPEHAYPHNIILELLAETGLVGCMLFIGLCGSLVMAVHRSPRSMVLCAFASFLFLLSMVGGDISSRLLWFGLGLLFATRERAPLNS